MGTATDLPKLNAMADAGLNPKLAKECCCAGNHDEKRLPVPIATLRNAVRIGPTGSQTNFVQIVFFVKWPRHSGLQRRRGCHPVPRAPLLLTHVREQSLKNLGIEMLDVFCMSRVDPNVPVEESVGGMAELVREGKTRFISLSECSAESLRRGSAVHPLTSLQMEYSLFSRDAEEQGQIDACKELGMAMMAYAVLGRGMLSAEVPKVEEMAADDIRADLPRFHSANKPAATVGSRDAIARRKNATLAQLSIAWPMVRGSRAGAFIVPIPGAKSRKHLEENVRAANIVLTADDLGEIDRIVPPGSASGTRYPIGQMHRVNL